MKKSITQKLNAIPLGLALTIAICMLAAPTTASGSGSICMYREKEMAQLMLKNRKARLCQPDDNIMNGRVTKDDICACVGTSTSGTPVSVGQALNCVKQWYYNGNYRCGKSK